MARSEYQIAGIPFDAGPTRAARFEEAVHIIRSLHNGAAVTHSDEFYELEECELSVEPVQHPIPLLLGGGGTRMTRFAAAHADVVCYVPRSLPGGGLDPAEFSVQAFDEKVAVLDSSLGERTDAGPERGVLLFYTGRTADAMPAGAGEWTSPEILSDSPYALVGDTDQMVDRLVERRERWGLAYFTCWEGDNDVLAPVVERLAGT